MRVKESTTEAARAVKSEATSSPLTVVKVGGSLLASLADLEKAATTLARRRKQGENLLVVASALKGVTDALEHSALQALHPQGGPGCAKESLEALRHRHESIANHLADPTALKQVQGCLAEVAELLASICSAGQLPEAVYARLLSYGERLSVPLLAAAVRAQGAPAQSMTAEDAGIAARGKLRAGVCDLMSSRQGLRSIPTDQDDPMVVVTGFYGTNHHGQVTLFGRGGSDDTACAVAASLEAFYLELWKDVHGFMSADPHAVGNAHVVAELSFDEVAKLGAYGSGIVHHGCLGPLRGRDTRIFICSVEGRHSTCTRLTENRPRQQPQVVAVAARQGWTELRLPVSLNGATSRALSSLREADVQVQSIRPSKRRLGLTIRNGDVDPARNALQSLLSSRPIQMRSRPSLVGMVGDGVATDERIRSRMLSCLAELGCGDDLIARPSGHAGLSCTVPQQHLMSAILGLHEHFITPLDG